ncbi:OmpA family protein [Vibrio albus]|nr:OmpA family protein [Vibrio albus]
MDISRWEYKGDQFSCLLNQKIKNFGDVAFIAEPNHILQFQLSSFRFPQPVDHARVYFLPSPYLDSQKKELVTQQAVIKNQKVIFTHSVAGLVSAVSRGAWIQVTTDASGESFSVRLPAVNINEPMARFNQCRAALPDMSFKQARDTELHYQLGQRTVNPEQKHILSQLAHYVRLDKKVTHVLIDGHTDNVGSAIGNRQISRVRADDVASILEAEGVRSALIEVRAHGARYPVASNETEQGQARNRRVTIRVIRSEGKG